MDWGGGVDFIIYVANALAANPNFKVFFLVADSAGAAESYFASEDELERYEKGVLERMKLFYRPLQISENYRINPALKDLSKDIKVVAFPNSTQGFLNALAKVRASVVLPTTASFGPAFPYPWVGYIWDYQHRYFPAYFNDNELSNRDNIFKKIMQDAPAVIVNSKQTEKDIRKFIRSFSQTQKIISLPFSPYPLSSWFLSRPRFVQKKYSINKPYFIVCNQFWMHKSHDTVMRAMAIVAKNNPSIDLVCTGKMEEPRSPKYIDQIKNLIKSLGLSKNVHLLGLVPKSDQIALLRGSISLVQPTLYEGGPGGGAAYNAVALGIPVIASDIPVNLEMEHENVIFFKAKSAADLAGKMIWALKRPASPTKDSLLIESGEKRLDRLCAALTITVDTAIRSFGAKHG